MVINVLSALLFAVPALTAAIYHDVQVAAGSVATLVTSVCYHATTEPIARRIDMATSAATIAYFMIQRCNVKNPRYIVAALCVAAVALVWSAKSKGKNSQAAHCWHALIHAVSAIGICFIVQPKNAIN